MVELPGTDCCWTRVFTMDCCLAVGGCTRERVFLCEDGWFLSVDGPFDWTCAGAEVFSFFLVAFTKHMPSQ